MIGNRCAKVNPLEHSELNNCSFIGRLGHDPEVKFVGKQKEQAVCNFSLAVDQGKDVEALWLRVTVWGDRAEFAANNLAKGNRVGITGPIRQDTWQDEDGNERTSLCITAYGLHMIDWASDSDEEKPAKKGGSSRRSEGRK